MPAWEARQMPDERRALAQAKALAGQHAGVICWKREVDVAAGDYGPSEVIYQHGSVPDLD